MGPTALLTDHYELTMVDAALADGSAARRCVFEVFARRLPAGRRYGVVAGIDRLLDLVPEFRFDDNQLAWLRSAGIVSRSAAEWLAAYRFTGTISGYSEGECFFPYSPILTVESTFAEAVVLETIILSVLNHDSAVAAAAARMVSAAAGRPCIEMGSRRTHERAAVAAARAAYVAGFDSTSNLAAGLEYGIPTRGTSSHAFSLLHETEREAFDSQIRAQGAATTLLIDTFEVPAAVRTAAQAGGPGLGAVRIDSGDLGEQAHSVRHQLDEAGLTSTRIVVTSDLDEYAIAALADAPVDAYGVGTRVVTGSGAPTADLVYKLVARESAGGEMVDVMKRSERKATRGGRKYASRRLDADGRAAAEVVWTASSHSARAGDNERHSARAGNNERHSARAGNNERHSARAGNNERHSARAWNNERDLLVRHVSHGEPRTSSDLRRTREQHTESLAELPRGARDLTPGDPAIPTVFLQR